MVSYLRGVGEAETAIWDFNGTVIDDVELVVRSVNVQLTKRGLPRLTVGRYRDVFCFPVHDYYRRIGLDPAAEAMADLFAEFHDEYAPGLAECSLHQGVSEVLDALADRGIRQFILSAMEERLLRSAVARLGIEARFDAVYGLAHRQADSKVERGRELLADFGIRPETAILIGDTDHDAEVADALGVRVVLVGAGHQSAARLRATGRPVYASIARFAAILAR